jgi:hypothetical protein
VYYRFDLLLAGFVATADHVGYLFDGISGNKKWQSHVGPAIFHQSGDIIQ